MPNEDTHSFPTSSFFLENNPVTHNPKLPHGGALDQEPKALLGGRRMRNGFPEQGLLLVDFQIGFGIVVRHQDFEQKKRDLPDRPSLMAVPEPV
jgi:hypothetical protein